MRYEVAPDLVLLFGVVLLWILALDKGLDEPSDAEDAQNEGIEVQQLLGQSRFADGGTFDCCLNLVAHKLPHLDNLAHSVDTYKEYSVVRDFQGYRRFCCDSLPQNISLEVKYGELVSGL